MFGINFPQRVVSPSLQAPSVAPPATEEDLEPGPRSPQARRSLDAAPARPHMREPKRARSFQEIRPPQAVPEVPQAATEQTVRERFAAAGGDLSQCSAAGLVRFERFITSANQSQIPTEKLARLLPWAAAACEMDENPFGLNEFISLAATSVGPQHKSADPLAPLALWEPALRGQSGSLPYWDAQTHTQTAQRVNDLMLRALAWRLPVTCQLDQWPPEAAEATVRRMLDCRNDAAGSLHLVQLARHNGLPLSGLLALAKDPATVAQAEAWFNLVRLLGPAEQLAVAQDTCLLTKAASLTPPLRCLVFLEGLEGLGEAGAALRESVWEGLAPTAAAPPEEAVRWHAVLPERPAWRNDWTTAVAILLPDTHWKLLARAGLEGRCLGPSQWPAPYGERGAALVACLETEPPAGVPHAPELDLVRDPSACVRSADWTALLGAFDRPKWLQALLQNETLRTDPEAAHAQQNRLQSLGRMLYALRCAGLDVNAEPSPSVARILAHVPSQAHRQTVLKAHLRALVGPQAMDWTAHVAHIVQAYTSHESRVLALILETQDAGISRERPVQSLLNCTALAHDGRAWQRLFNLFASPREASATFGRHVARWPTGENLLQMLPHAMQSDGPLALAQAYAADPQQATPLRLQCQRSDTTSKVAAALVADYHSQGLAPRSIAEYLDGERLRLNHSLQWLATQPGYDRVAQAALELLQCSGPHTHDDVTGPTAKARAKARNAAIAAAKANLRAAHAQAPRGPLRAWADVLGKQVERCIPPPVRQGQPEVQAAPAESFYQQTPVRQFFNQHVLALALGLQEFAGILARLNVDVDTLHSPAAVRGRALELFGEEGEGDLWRRMQEKIYRPEIYLMYTALSSEWSYSDLDLADGVLGLRQVTQSLLDGTYPQLRRTSAQMQTWLKEASKPTWLHAWETDPQPQRAATQGDFTLQDTADPGKMLHATTEISSCQSIDGGRLNVGMLGRMLCGSKRMLLMHDSAGNLAARAMLRLLRDADGRPVVGLSKIYSAHGTRHAQAFEAYALQRAQALGLRAARTHAVLNPCETVLHSAAAKVPDYWDDTEVLSYQAQTLKGEILS